MSPTAILLPLYTGYATVAAGSRGRGCTRVVGSWVGREEGYTGTQAHPSQAPIFSHIQALEPTHGQMKEN